MKLDKAHVGGPDDRSLPPEAKLLIEYIRLFFGTGDNRTIETLAPRTDWTVLTKLARRHRVTPLVSRALAQSQCRADSVTIRDFEQRHAVIAAQNIRLSHELVKVLSLLDENGIPAVPWKGPTLGALAYGDTSLRQFDDLDILVDHSTLLRTDRVLRAAGYRRRFPDDDRAEAFWLWARRDFVYDVPGAECGLQIGSRVVRHPVSFGPTFKQLCGGLTEVRLEGYHAQTLKPDLLLICLCAHGTKHFWPRLQWVCDIAALAQAYGPDRIIADEAFCVAHRARRVVLLGQTLAEAVTHVPIHGWAAGDHRERRTVATLVESCWPRLLARNALPPPPLKSVRFLCQAHDRLSDAARYAVALPFHPGVREWTSLQLPPPLRFLYRILRPLRLAANLLLSMKRRP